MQWKIETDGGHVSWNAELAQPDDDDDDDDDDEINLRFKIVFYS